MPQMAPINWLFLFFMFTFIYLMFCILNYFTYNIIYPIQTSNNIYNAPKFLIWKW